MSEKQTQFQWVCHPKAETLILNYLEECIKENSAIAELQKSLFKHTSTRLFDWVDHVVVNSSPQSEFDLEEAGFVQESATPSTRVFHHPGAKLPRVVVKD